MNAGAKAGLLLGSSAIVLCDWAPQPWGVIAFWAIQVVYLLIYTVVTSRRTRSTVQSVGGAAATAGAGVMLVLGATGESLSTLPMPLAVPVYSLFGIVVLSVIAGPFLSPQVSEEWKQRVREMGLWDHLMLRHIPRVGEPDT